MLTVYRNVLGLWLVVLLVGSCMTAQSRYSMLGQSYPSKPEGFDVQVFYDVEPPRPYVKISRLDVHLEKSHFIRSSLDDALAELKKQARLSGADAIIQIRENSSMVGDTNVYHVTAVGIHYSD